MTHVAPQTAAALKAAGFPQPGPDTRQLWYNDAGTPYYVTAANGWLCDYVAGDTLFIDRYLNGGEVFAPTAEDILAELSKRVYPNIVRIDISAYDSSFPNSVQEPKYYVYSFPIDHFLNSEFGPGIAEVLASAYLSLSKPDA